MRGGCQGECTRASAKVYQGVGVVQTKIAEQRHVFGRIRACLAVIAQRVVGIEMLITGVCELVWEPARTFHVDLSPFLPVTELSSAHSAFSFWDRSKADRDLVRRVPPVLKLRTGCP
jgi:hypothetical protein